MLSKELIKQNLSEKRAIPGMSFSYIGNKI